MNIQCKTQVTFSAMLTLSEVEMRALDALVGYGTEPFIDHFYKTLGKAYLEDHVAGIRSLFDTIKSNVPTHLANVDEMRKRLREAKP